MSEQQTQKDFILYSKIQIRNNDETNWKNWEEEKSLDVGQFGLVTDKNILVCGDNSKKIFAQEAKEDEDGIPEFIVSSVDNKPVYKYNLLPRIPFVIMGPMYQEDGTELTEENYEPVEGALLLLYDNSGDITTGVE